MSVNKNLIRLVPALESDFEELLALRIKAMRESLERIGRFDPIRSRDRFQAGFSAIHTRHVVQNQKRVGFIVIKAKDDHVLLDHLYIHPDHQSEGIGSAVVEKIIQEADEVRLPLHVCALRGSDANHFYQKHGFRYETEEEWDIYYVRPLSINTG